LGEAFLAPGLLVLDRDLAADSSDGRIPDRRFATTNDDAIQGWSDTTMHLRNDSSRGLCLATMIVLAATQVRAAAQDDPQTQPAILGTPVPTTGGLANGEWARNGSCECAPTMFAPRRSLTLKFIPYFWLTEMDGEVTIRGETAPAFVSMGEMWDLFTHDLNMAFLGQFEAKYGRVGLLANGVYLDLSPGGEVRGLQFNSSYAQTIIDLVMTYDLLGGDESSNCGRSAQFELLAGARYNSLNGDISLTGPRGNTVSVGGAEAWTDLIVGARAHVPLNERLALLCRADVGGFGINGCSQLTWNVEAAAEYQYSERTSLFAGYRLLRIDYTRGDFGYDMRIDGPMAGFVFKF
jgi:hypothetical protein